MIRAMRGLGRPEARALEKPFNPKRVPHRKEVLLSKKFLLSMECSSFQPGIGAFKGVSRLRLDVECETSNFFSLIQQIAFDVKKKHNILCRFWF